MTNKLTDIAGIIGASKDRELAELLEEKRKRETEALRLYEPAQWQDNFHRSTASERVICAAVRTGKTLAAAAEFTRAITGQDPYGKYPKEGGLAVVVGRNWKHIGLTIYPMLFEPGAFKLIKDLQTGKLRAFRPVQDKGRESERVESPPLIPERFYSMKDFAWQDRAEHQFSSLTLKNGWKIHAFSSDALPPKGFKANAIWIDEDLENDQDWVGELQSRLPDVGGKLWWSAMPESRNQAMINMVDRADAQAGRANPDVVAYRIAFVDNPHISEEEKRKRIEGWMAEGPDVYNKRALGLFITDSYLMYPMFSRESNGMSIDELPNKQVPSDWTRFAAIDPGYGVAAAVFGAIPPSEDFLLIYDELYVEKSTAQKFAEAFHEKTKNNVFRAFIIDMHGGRLSSMDTGRPIHLAYTDEFRKRNVRSETTGSAFVAGCDDPIARSQELRQMINPSKDGRPYLRILEGTCHNLIESMRRYRRKSTKVNGRTHTLDAPESRGDVHLCQTLEYLAAYRPRYSKPPKAPKEKPWFIVEYEKKLERAKQRDGGEFVNLGPRSRNPLN